MRLLTIISGIIVLLFCTFLFGLSIMIIFKPKIAEQFLSSFASSARAHFIEQFGRLAVGVAVVVFSPWMWYSDLLNIFGWLLIITSIGLLLIPWQWHNKFGELVIPLAIRFKNFFAFGAFVLGVLILYCFSRFLIS